MKGQKISIIFLVFFLVVLATGYIVYNVTAGNPTAFKLKVYKVELYQDKTSTPVVVFNNTSGVEADLINNPESLFGQGEIPAGTYKRIKFTIDQNLIYSGIDPCDNKTQIQDQSFDIGSTTLVFATADDGGGSGWVNNGSEQAPFLMLSPIKVEPDATTKVKISFNTEGLLQCVNNNPTVLPPTISVTNWVTKKAPPQACTFPADYWFVHFNISTGIHCGLEGGQWVCRDDSGNQINLDNITDILKVTTVVSGWGKLTLNDNGTATVDPTKTAENGGMAEHRHHLYDNYTDPEDGYHNPLGGQPMSINYVISGRKVIFFMEDSQAEGYFNQSCDVLIATNWGNRDNDIIYAVKTANNHSPTFSQGTYISTNPFFGVTYDNNTGIVKHLHFDGNIHLIKVRGTNTAMSFDWKTYFEISYSGTDSLTASKPTEYGNDNSSIDLSGFSISPDGRLSPPPGYTDFDSFVALNSNDVGINAGATREFRTYPSLGDSHELFAGAFMRISDTAQISDLDGTWYFVSLESKLDPGNDNTWNTGDEQLGYGISKGEVIISNGQFISLSSIYRDIFSGQINYDTGGSGIQITQSNECYWMDQDLDNTTNCPGITLNTFKAQMEPGRDLRMLLDSTKTVMFFWDTVDVDDTVSGSIKDRPQDSNPPTTNYYGSQKAIRGYAVKIQ